MEISIKVFFFLVPLRTRVLKAAGTDLTRISLTDTDTNPDTAEARTPTPSAVQSSARGGTATVREILHHAIQSLSLSLIASFYIFLSFRTHISVSAD
jgi:hypothetical protein